MKKQLVAFVLFASLVLAGCRNNNKNPESGTDLSTTGTTMTAKQAIQAYLDAANKDIQVSTVAKGDLVTVDYIGRLDDETVFDTSVESVARAAGKYNEMRNYSEGLEFTVGAGQMIAGFDAGVVGMKLGETKTLTIPASQAYWEVNPDLIWKIPVESFSGLQASGNLQVGTKILLSNYIPATITEITDTEVTVDANHELAGKDLIFDVTIKNIAPGN